MLIPNLILLGGLAVAAYRVRFRRHQKLAVMLTQTNHASVVEENKYLIKITIMDTHNQNF